MNYINRLTSEQIKDLLTEMRISKHENINKLPYAIYGGKLHVVHGKNKNNEKIESIYGEYEIEKIYNSAPSAYDQRRFLNCMITLLHKTNYLKDMTAYFDEINKESGIE